MGEENEGTKGVSRRKGEIEKQEKRKEGREKKERKRKYRKTRKKKGRRRRRRGRRSDGGSKERRYSNTQKEKQIEIWKEIRERGRGGRHTHTHTSVCTHTCVSE